MEVHGGHRHGHVGCPDSVVRRRAPSTRRPPSNGKGKVGPNSKQRTPLTPPCLWQWLYSLIIHRPQKPEPRGRRCSPFWQASSCLGEFLLRRQATGRVRVLQLPQPGNQRAPRPPTALSWPRCPGPCPTWGAADAALGRPAPGGGTLGLGAKSTPRCPEGTRPVAPEVPACTPLRKGKAVAREREPALAACAPKAIEVAPLVTRGMDCPWQAGVRAAALGPTEATLRRRTEGARAR